MNPLLKAPLMKIHQFVSRLESVFDKGYLAADVPEPVSVRFDRWREYLYAEGNKPGKRILEIGSREVTGRSEARMRFRDATYVGFDYYPGPNVDVVGDAHSLSSYFNESEKFDIIYSSACFEHFAMPWLVAGEIAKLLNVGGLVFIETHFAFSSHERPWHFFHFTDLGLKALFSPALGFECIEAGMSNPLVARFSRFAERHLRFRPLSHLYAHSEYLGRKTRHVENINWNKLDLSDVVNGTEYPEPKQ
jgi:hypothetical protein